MKQYNKLCFGSLPMAFFQNNFTIEEGAKLINYAYNKGVRYFDTAELYQTYDIIREGLKHHIDDVIISTKTHASTWEMAEAHVEKALSLLNRKYIDIFFIHAPKIEDPFSSRKEVLDCLKSFKSKGIIKHIGIATHRVDVVREAAKHSDIEYVFALLNISGIGIMGGSKDDMKDAIEKASGSGKKIVGMKALGGGTLIHRAEEAIDYLLSNNSIDIVAMGMTSELEIDVNHSLFTNKAIEAEKWELVKNKNRSIRILKFCKGCGICLEMCSAGAIGIREKKAYVNIDECVLCGYCASKCPNFSIRVS